MFGCLAHVKVQSIGLGKLDDRSVDMVYIGKEPGTKAHRLYNPTTGRLHVSRDVVFEEEKGWYWEHHNIQGKNFPDNFILVDTRAGLQEKGNEDSPHTPSNLNSSTQGSAYGGNNSVSAMGSYSTTEMTGSSSEAPTQFRLLSDIYNDTEEIDISDEELLLIGIEEPRSFEEAKTNEEWNKAMRTELEAIEKNKTWVLTDLPVGRKPISLKWVYKIKKDTNGEIVKYKAILVARGYVQKKRHRL